jgi:molybdopterin/thiamine biosynthesis adenylyltransferase
VDTTIAFHGQLWEELMAALDEPRESAGVVLAGLAVDDDRLTLLANRIEWVPDECYELRDRDQLVITSRGWMPALRHAADEGWQPIFFHTHPGAPAGPSRRDHAVNDALERPFRIRAGAAYYAAFTLGGTRTAPSFSGRVTDGNETVQIERVRVAGPRIHLLVVGDDGEPPAPFDRQVRAFGAEGQRVLRRLRAGIVGGGGTGSAVAELLIRLGVGEIVMVDDDEVTDTNLTRIHGSVMADVGRAKTELAEAQADAIGLGSRLEPVVAKVTEVEAMKRLRGCDVVFGCTDDNAGRIVLSRLAYWYCIPVIDMGVVIRATEGEITGLYGRVTTMVPGDACLICRGRVDLQLARDEQQPTDERERLAREGYAQGLGDPDPAVVTYTTLVAALAVDELKRRLFGFGAPAAELLISISDRELRRPGRSAAPTHFCGDREQWCRGDEDPPLGQTWVV